MSKIFRFSKIEANKLALRIMLDDIVELIAFKFKENTAV